MLANAGHRWQGRDMSDETRKAWRRRALALLGLAVVGSFMLRWFEHQQVFQPAATLRERGDALGRAWEDVYFSTSDGVRLNAWFFPAKPDSPRAQWAVLLCHGNGGNISHRLDSYEALLTTGVSVLAFDYRGYGRSAGRPSEAGTYRDAQAAHAWLREKGFAATRILALGESLGGGVATELAVRAPLGGLILQSTFTSVPDLGAEVFPWLPVRTMGRIKYDTLAKLPQLRLPVLVLHSRVDRLIPFHHAERLFAAANEPKLLSELAGDHNETFEADRDKFIAGVERLLRVLEREAGK